MRSVVQRRRGGVPMRRRQRRSCLCLFVLALAHPSTRVVLLRGKQVQLALLQLFHAFDQSLLFRLHQAQTLTHTDLLFAMSRFAGTALLDALLQT